MKVKKLMYVNLYIMPGTALVYIALAIISGLFGENLKWLGITVGTMQPMMAYGGVILLVGFVISFFATRAKGKNGRGRFMLSTQMHALTVALLLALNAVSYLLTVFVVAISSVGDNPIEFSAVDKIMMPVLMAPVAAIEIIDAIAATIRVNELSLPQDPDIPTNPLIRREKIIATVQTVIIYIEAVFTALYYAVMSVVGLLI